MDHAPPVESVASRMTKAADPAYMLELFQRELPALSDAPLRVSACTASAKKTRTALKKGKTLVLYRVRVETADGSREQALVGRLPVTPEFPGDALRELCLRAEGHPEAGPFRRLALFVPELELGLHVFPVDPELPAVLGVTHPQGMREPARFLHECRAGMEVDAAHAEVLHYKPGKRCVVRLALELSGGGRAPCRRVVYVKLFGDEHGAVVYRDMRALWELQTRSRCLRVPEALGYDPALRMLVMAEASGEGELEAWVECLEHGSGLPPDVDRSRLERCVTTVTTALAELHGSGIRPETELTFEKELDDVRDDAGLARWPRELAGEIPRLLERLAAEAPRDERLVPCHGGFGHKALLGNDRQLTLLDWDDLKLANPALDAASFLCRLRQVPIARPGWAPELERLAALFRAGFLAAESEMGERELRLYEALALARAALRTLRHEKDARESLPLARSLFAESGRLLDALPPRTRR
jgi:hypothetical protein